MANNFLLEIGLEEIPAHVVTPSINQLKKRAADFLKEQRISFNQIKTFSTPRRLALYITGLADKQPDIDESVKGPAKKSLKIKMATGLKPPLDFLVVKVRLPTILPSKTSKELSMFLLKNILPENPPRKYYLG